jgi:uncharacterized protein YlxW (UPF0749 family)
MPPGEFEALIPIVAFGGFFAWMIARALSKAYVAKLQAQSQPAPVIDARQREELVAAVEELRREVAELAERVDFTERLLAKPRADEGLAPPR